MIPDLGVQTTACSPAKKVERLEPLIIRHRHGKRGFPKTQVPSPVPPAQAVLDLRHSTQTSFLPRAGDKDPFNDTFLTSTAVDPSRSIDASYGPSALKFPSIRFADQSQASFNETIGGDDARSKVKQNLVLDLDKYREFRTWRTTLLQAQRSRAKAKFDQLGSRREGSNKSPEGLRELQTIREAKRQVVRRQKEILDCNHRKIKVFQYLKPVLIQQYKQDFI